MHAVASPRLRSACAHPQPRLRITLRLCSRRLRPPPPPPAAFVHPSSRLTPPPLPPSAPGHVNPVAHAFAPDLRSASPRGACPTRTISATIPPPTATSPVSPPASTSVVSNSSANHPKPRRNRAIHHPICSRVFHGIRRAAPATERPPPDLAPIAAMSLNPRAIHLMPNRLRSSGDPGGNAAPPASRSVVTITSHPPHRGRSRARIIPDPKLHPALSRRRPNPFLICAISPSSDTSPVPLARMRPRTTSHTPNQQNLPGSKTKISHLSVAPAAVHFVKLNLR